MVIKILKFLLIAVLLAFLLAVAIILYLQRTSDGPIEPMQGGPFVTGEIVNTPVHDWTFAAANPVPFELEAFGTTRMAGFIMHEGEAYMTCDLGFIWNRLQPGMQKTVLRVLYTFKQWHTDAVEDGRGRIRIDGNIYPVMFSKVEDPALNQALRDTIEAQAQEYFAPLELGPEPEEAPNDIWFFKMESRTL